jgi:hypothetical protein
MNEKNAWNDKNELDYMSYTTTFIKKRVKL